MYKCKSIFLKLWNFKSWLNFARKKLARANSIWHFWFLIAEAYLEPSQTSTIKLFRISGKSSIVDVRLCLRIGYCNLHFSSRLFSLLSRFFFFFFLRKIIQGKRHEVKQERLSAVILTYRFSKSFSILFHLSYLPSIILSVVVFSYNAQGVFINSVVQYHCVSNLTRLYFNFNLFLANVSVLYLLKTPENQRFCGVFRGY